MTAMVLRAACLVTLAATALSAPAQAATDPADQAPFGGAEVPALVDPGGLDAQPAGFSLDVHAALDLANVTPEAREFFGRGADEGGDVHVAIATRGDDRWEVRYRRDGEIEALVIIDDRAGEVVEAWTGAQVETKLARGYEDAVAGDLNEWYVWIPLCVLFVAPFVFPRRLIRRLIHLDLLALLGFSASLFFFNKGEIGVSAPLVYPVLAYLLVRMLVAGFRPDDRPRSEREPLTWARPSWLAAAIALLAAFHVYWAVDRAKVIDVGVAGVVGADRLADGEDIYSEDFTAELPESGDVRGDVYGPVNYLAYVPAEQAFGWEDEWDDVPAARYAALAFDLLTALALFLLGGRLRDRGDGGGDPALGLALAFAWLAYPFTLYTLGSSFNDSLVALAVVACMLALASPPGRGALAALSGLTKFGTLALVPLFAAGTGDRRPRTILVFGLAFVAAAAIVTVPLLPDGGPRELYDRSIGYQASRGSPFSLWGQAPSLDPLQTLTKVFAVGLAVAVFFVPRRRSVAQVAALGAAVMIAVQATANHWFYPYAVWFAPLVLAAVFSSYWTTRQQVSDTRTR
jgi:hypothetical protein